MLHLYSPLTNRYTSSIVVLSQYVIIMDTMHPFISVTCGNAGCKAQN